MARQRFLFDRESTMSCSVSGHSQRRRICGLRVLCGSRLPTMRESFLSNLDCKVLENYHSQGAGIRLLQCVLHHCAHAEYFYVRQVFLILPLQARRSFRSCHARSLVISRRNIVRRKSFEFVVVVADSKVHSSNFR